ncbi:MAG: OmpA family protein [Leptospirales bacterium]
MRKISSALFIGILLLFLNVPVQSAQKKRIDKTSNTSAAANKENSVKFLQITWLDFDFMNFFPIPDTRLSDFTNSNAGGGIRLNFMLLDIKRLWLFASLLVDNNDINTHRMDNLIDYSAAIGGGWRFTLFKRFYFTPRFSYGIMLHSTYGDYYNAPAIYPNDSRVGTKKDRYFTDQYTHYELEFAYDLSPIFKAIDAEVFLAPSFIHYLEKHRQGLEYGYLAGVRMKFNPNSFVPKAKLTLLAGKVVDKKTGQTLEDIQPVIFEDNPAKTKKGEGETFAYKVEAGKTYVLKVDHEDYEPLVYKVDGRKLIAGQRKNVILPLIIKDVWGFIGHVFDLKTKNPIHKVKIYVTWKDEQDKSDFTDKKGDFRMKIGPKTKYDIILKKRGYFTVRAKFSTVGKKPGYYDIMKSMNTPIQKEEVGATIEFGPILFDTGSWAITPTGALVLNKMAQFLKDNPKIVVELGAHTDSQGNAKSNQTLSQKRAQSAVEYLIRMGIIDTRITAKGYGENKLKNHCADGVKCSGGEHQVNRRIELTVLDIK